MSITAELATEQETPHGDAAATHTAIQHLINLYRPRLGGFLVLCLYLLTLAIIFTGWRSSAERPLTPEYGLGYALGIIGGCLMLLLLFYPLRKHARFMRNFGPVRHWFRLHMLFGVLGPVCILFHCGFSLGSLNSNIALFCMLTVASSGLIGRYFYTRIHYGLYGARATFDELLEHAARLDQSLDVRLGNDRHCVDAIRLYENQVRQPPAGIFSSLKLFGSLGLRTWSLYFSLWLRFARDLPARQRRSRLRHIGARLECIRKIAGFNFYTRLFAAWHALHFPLFLMLIVSGLVHVVAVHMY